MKVGSGDEISKLGEKSGIIPVTGPFSATGGVLECHVLARKRCSSETTFVRYRFSLRWNQSIYNHDGWQSILGIHIACYEKLVYVLCKALAMDNMHTQKFSRRNSQALIKQFFKERFLGQVWCAGSIYEYMAVMKAST